MNSPTNQSINNESFVDRIGVESLRIAGIQRHGNCGEPAAVCGHHDGLRPIFHAARHQHLPAEPLGPRHSPLQV